MLGGPNMMETTRESCCLQRPNNGSCLQGLTLQECLAEIPDRVGFVAQNAQQECHYFSTITGMDASDSTWTTHAVKDRFSFYQCVDFSSPSWNTSPNQVSTSMTAAKCAHYCQEKTKGTLDTNSNSNRYKNQQYWHST